MNFSRSAGVLGQITLIPIAIGIADSQKHLQTLSVGTRWSGNPALWTDIK
jgi:hypothetical protein